MRPDSGPLLPDLQEVLGIAAKLQVKVFLPVLLDTSIAY